MSSSWTIITWVIIPGSSLVMLLWIVLYSFFESFDFVDEVQRLFGGVTFWVTVIVAVAIALRELAMLSSGVYSPDLLVPRVFVKFASTSFASQDVDIVRYMWVKGDLKDRLGIKHRHRHDQNVPVDGPSSDLEGTPMFREPHARSTSEMSTADIYQPGLPRVLGNGKQSDTTQQINTLLAAPSSSPQHIPMASTSEDGDMTPTSPISEARPTVMSPSPQPSYYSASDIPLPSPLPSPVFHDPSQAYPKVAPISYSRPFRGQYLSPHPDNLRLHPGSYEMRVHSPKSEENLSRSKRQESSEAGEAF